MMKITMPQIVKKLSCLLLTLTAAVTLHAQNDDRAFAAAMDSIISNSKFDAYIVNRIVDDAFQKHSKSAYLASCIARSYYYFRDVDNGGVRDRQFANGMDTARAFKYIYQSIAIDPKYAAPYVLASDIISWEKRPNGTEEAIDWLNRGIAMNPTDSSLYMAYAELLVFKDRNAAIEKLKEFKQKVPSFPLDIKLARMYYKIYDYGGSSEERYSYLENMVNHFSKVQLSDMTKGDLGSYAMGLMFLNRNSECLEVSSYALNIYPDDFGFNKFFLAAAVRLNKWKESIEIAQKIESLFPEKMEPEQYIQWGVALKNNDQFDEALKKYEHVLTMEKASAGNVKDAENNISMAMDAKVSDFEKKGEYQTALVFYKKYLDHRIGRGKLQASMLSTYANIYMYWSQELNGQDKEDAMMKADAIFAQIVNEFPEYNDYGMEQRFNIRVRLDPESEKGLAKPYAEQLISFVLQKDDLNKMRRNRLSSAYQYMAYYYFIKRNYKEAISYCDKVLEIDDKNGRAIKIKEISEKYNVGKRKR